LTGVKFMSKVLAVLMAVAFAFGATACGTTSSASGDVAAARVMQQQNFAGGPN
jgi:hypothetical protein